MAQSGGEKWVLPSSIPFDRLKARDLEECIYWLMDSLGARDLEWRTGGAGNGAADGGRDLEAWFYSPAPDGDMEGQRWWIECKGRSGTLEPDAVKHACVNAHGQKDLAYLVIVTNTDFSNPTRDWVKEWQVKNPVPKVKLWDRSSLERMLSKHPGAVARLFDEALSTAGLLEVVREGFWNRFDHASPKALQSFWAERETLEIGELELVALIVSEFANGDISRRPWGVACTPHERVYALASVVGNLPYLSIRANRAGINQEPLIRGVAYLIQAALMRATAESVAEIILAQLSGEDDEPFPANIRSALLDPILTTLLGDLGDICSNGCPRIMLNEPRSLIGGADPSANYWARLRPEGGPQAEDDGRRFHIEATREPCAVGFALDGEHSCPLFEDLPEPDKLAELLAIVDRVTEFRMREAADTHPADGT